MSKSKKFSVGSNNVGMMKNIANKVNNIDSKSSFNIRNIDTGLLVPSEKNMYSISDIQSLAEDIKENGLYHNLVVRPIADDKYEIISGERRYHALKSLNWSKIPCQVREGADDIDSEIMLIQANAKTRVLSDIEKARQVKRLEELYTFKKKNGEKIEGKVRDQIGKDLGLSGIQVQRYSRINKLIPELQQLLQEEKIAMSAVEQFASLDEESQKIIYNSLVEVGSKITREEATKIRKDYQDKLDGMETDLKNMKKELEETDKIIELKDKQVQTYANEVERLTNELNTMNDTISDYKEEIDNYRKSIESLEQKQKKSKDAKEIKVLQNEIDKLTIELQKKEQEKETITKDYSKKLQKKEKEIDKSNLQANIEIELLLKQAHHTLSMLSNKVNNNVDGFMLNEENTKKLEALKFFNKFLALESINLRNEAAQKIIGLVEETADSTIDLKTYTINNDGKKVDTVVMSDVKMLIDFLLQDIKNYFKSL